MEIEVVNAGNCMICGKPIKLAIPRHHNKLPNIFFCRECEPKLEYDGKRPENEEESHSIQEERLEPRINHGPNF